MPLREMLDIFALGCIHEEKKDARCLIGVLGDAIESLQSMVDEITEEQDA